MDTERGIVLTEKSLRFLRLNGGTATEDELARHVFGVATNPTPWLPLLRKMLAGSDLFHRTDEGIWSLVGSSDLPGSLRDGNFTALAMEVSGRNPVRHRVIEVAAVRVRKGRVVDEFVTLIHPTRTLPKYVVTSTGITEEMLEEAPGFETVAGTFRDFLGSDLLVGFGVTDALAQWQHQLLVSGWPPLSNRITDLLSFADHLLPPDKKLHLTTLAGHLGLSTKPKRRALPDAHLAAAILLRLLAGDVSPDLAALGVFLRSASFQTNPEREVREGSISRRRLASEELPAQPGVYLMKDREGRVLYVGKARILCQRVSSYFSQPLSYVRNIDGLLEMTDRLDYRVSGSDLEARLWETALIRELKPPFNVQRQYRDSLLYVKVELDAAFPRLMTVREIDADGAKYFGPFRNGRAAKEAIRWVSSIFPLRTCRRSLTDRKGRRKKGRPCLLYGTGRCMGPCRPEIGVDEYRALLDEAVRFLTGDKEGARARLMAALNTARQRRDYAREENVRRSLHQLGRGSIGEMLLASGVEARNLVIVQPSRELEQAECFVLYQARFVGQVRVSTSEIPAGLAARLKAMVSAEKNARPVWHQSEAPIPSQSDAVNVLARWVFANAGESCIVPLPAEIDSADLQLSALAVIEAARLAAQPVAGCRLREIINST